MVLLWLVFAGFQVYLFGLVMNAASSSSGPPLGRFLPNPKLRFLDQCRRARLAEFEPFVDDEPRTTSESEEWSDTLEWSDQRLGEALGRLRAEERAALYLSAVEGRSAQQIAGLFGWPRSTVLSLVQRARRKLRTWMESPEATR